MNIYPPNINHSLVLIHNPNMILEMVQCHCLNKCFDVYIKFEMIKFNFILFCWWQKIVISFWHYIKLNLGTQFKEKQLTGQAQQ